MKTNRILTTAIILLTSSLAAFAATNNDKIPGATVQDAAFFTGKPYDADLESYVFNYRNYSAEVGRWTTADPSGFPDGANTNHYSPCPTTQVDYLGLSRITVKGTPTSNIAANPLGLRIINNPKVENGAGTMGINWLFSGGIFSSGWIVQNIQITNSLLDSNGSPISDSFSTHNYYEAWQIQNGTVLGNGDFFNTGSYSSATQGSFTISGSASYFSSFSNNSPSSWSTAQNTSAHGLPYTTVKPDWWTTGSVNHTLTLTVE